MYYSKDLYLDAVTEEGLQALYRLYNDYDIQAGIESTNNLVVPRRYETFKEDIGDGAACFIVKLRDKHTVVGYCSIYTNWLTHVSRPSLYIGKEFRGKGYGKQLVALILYVSFHVCNARKASLIVYDFNERAKHLYAQVGFQEEGRQREEVYRDGMYWDIVYMGLFRKDWREYWKTQVQKEGGAFHENT